MKSLQQAWKNFKIFIYKEKPWRLKEHVAVSWNKCLTLLLWLIYLVFLVMKKKRQAGLIINNKITFLKKIWFCFRMYRWLNSKRQILSLLSVFILIFKMNVLEISKSSILKCIRIFKFVKHETWTYRVPAWCHSIKEGWVLIL